MSAKDTCDFYSLNALFGDRPSTDKKSSQLFHSHKGHFAYWHAMSTDPEHTNRKIKNKIVNSLISYFLVACKNNDYFVMGNILHTLTDSYSPAHTIRSYDQHYSTNNYALPIDEEYEYIKGEAKKDEIIKELLYSEEYKHLKYEYDLEKDARKIISLDDLDIIYKNNKRKPYDIISFQYFLNQPFLLHQKLDFLGAVKDEMPDAYARMIMECVEFFLIFRKKSPIKSRVREFAEFIMTKTFAMTDENLDQKSDKYVDYQISFRFT